jgi:hypothetical protein
MLLKISLLDVFDAGAYFWRKEYKGVPVTSSDQPGGPASDQRYARAVAGASCGRLSARGSGVIGTAHRSIYTGADPR